MRASPVRRPHAVAFLQLSPDKKKWTTGGRTWSTVVRSTLAAQLWFTQLWSQTLARAVPAHLIFGVARRRPSRMYTVAVCLLFCSFSLSLDHSNGHYRSHDIGTSRPSIRRHRGPSAIFLPSMTDRLTAERARPTERMGVETSQRCSRLNSPFRQVDVCRVFIFVILKLLPMFITP